MAHPEAARLHVRLADGFTFSAEVPADYTPQFSGGWLVYPGGVVQSALVASAVVKQISE